MSISSADNQWNWVYKIPCMLTEYLKMCTQEVKLSKISNLYYFIQCTVKGNWLFKSKNAMMTDFDG